HAAASQPAICRTLARGCGYSTQTITHRALGREPTLAFCRTAAGCCGSRLPAACGFAGIDLVACGTPRLSAGVTAPHGASRDAEFEPHRTAGRLSQIAGQTHGRC